MPKLDSNIYGSDPVGMASAVAADALDTERPGENIANYWGDTIKQSAQSRSAKDTLRLAETATAKAKTQGGGRDDRACTEGNHGKQGCNE
jgi:hypothetical protein